MGAVLSGKTIVSPWVVLVILIIVIFGYILVNFIANRKWGYTPKREKELENIDKRKF